MADMLLEKQESTAQPHEDDLRQFLREIRVYPLLTQEQELALAKRCAQGDADAIRTMVNSNLRLVVSIAREYAGRGIPLLDLIQEGSIGLLSAARNYDYTQECRFSTYARQWIHQGIDRCVLNHGSMIRIPLHTMEKIRKLVAIRSVIFQEMGTEPPVEEIAKRAGFTVEKTRELLGYLPQIWSLDNPAGDDGTLQIMIENLQAPQPYEELVRAELAQNIQTLLGLLDERQRYVLRLHFGMEDGICHSLEEIGKGMGISKQRAGQLERQAFDKLKRLGADIGLEEFLK